MTHEITVIELVTMLTELMEDDNDIANMTVMCSYDYHCAVTDVYGIEEIDKEGNMIILEGY